MRPKTYLRPSPSTALKAIAFLALYLTGLSLMPSAAAAFRALTQAERIAVADMQEPAR
jgi:hypothetical protein